MRKRIIPVALLVCLGLMMLIVYAAHPLFTDLRPERGPSGDAVIVISGDMGFRTGLSPELAKRIAARGRYVVGVNSLRFAWRKRTPAEISRLLESAVDRALTRSGARRVVLIGQSYGADLVHVGSIGLRQAARDKIAAVVLVVPTTDVYYGIGPLEYLGWGSADAKALDTARQLRWAPLTCIYGRQESDSVCPSLGGTNLRRIALPGDHYLQHDPDRLFAAVWPAIRRAEGQ